MSIISLTIFVNYKTLIIFDYTKYDTKMKTLELTKRQNELKAEIAELNDLYSQTSMANETFEYYAGLKDQLNMVNHILVHGN